MIGDELKGICDGEGWQLPSVRSLYVLILGIESSGFFDCNEIGPGMAQKHGEE